MFSVDSVALLVSFVALLRFGEVSGVSTCACAPNPCNSTTFNLTEIVADETLTYLDCFHLPPQSIPEGIGRLTEMTLLEIFSSPTLFGTIPSEIGLLDKLKLLVIYDNHGLHGTIPTELGNLRLLEGLTLDLNLHLTGTVPSEFGELTKLTSL